MLPIPYVPDEASVGHCVHWHHCLQVSDRRSHDQPTIIDRVEITTREKFPCGHYIVVILLILVVVDSSLLIYLPHSNA